MKHILFTALLLTSYATLLRAQDMNEELKLKLRESLLTPGNPRELSQQRIELLQKDDVLKVSPTTKLPTKSDRLLIIPKQEMKIHLNLNTTNSTPVNMRPRGSMAFEPNGRGMSMVSTAGKLVVPSGKNFSPSRERSEKRRLKVKKIIETY